jgi:ammonia channel protein AmtB
VRGGLQPPHLQRRRRFTRPCGWDTGLTSSATGCALQVIGILCIIAWVGGLSTIMFGALKAAGVIRISADDEFKGIDASKHGGSAYNGTDAVMGGTHHVPSVVMQKQEA